MSEQPAEKQVEPQEILPDLSDLGEVIPQMNVNLPAQPQEAQPQPCIVSDEALLGLYGEIVDNCRKDRAEIDGLLANFVEMVINEGDSTTASKEALVNLVKIKSDTADKMAKVADLMTRVKLRERDTYKPYLNAHQENKVYIGTEVTRRDLLKEIDDKLKRKK